MTSGFLQFWCLKHLRLKEFLGAKQSSEVQYSTRFFQLFKQDISPLNPFDEAIFTMILIHSACIFVAICCLNLKHISLITLTVALFLFFMLFFARNNFHSAKIEKLRSLKLHLVVRFPLYLWHTERCRSFRSHKYIPFKHYQSPRNSYNMYTFIIRSNQNSFRVFPTRVSPALKYPNKVVRYSAGIRTTSDQI